MQKGFAQIYLGLVLIIIAIISGAYYLGQQKLTSFHTPAPLPTQKLNQASPTASSNNGNYINPQMGISLIIPASWEGKYKDQLSASPSSRKLDFIYLGKDKEYRLFSIIETPGSEWSEIQKDPILQSQSKKLATKEGLVYYSTHSLDNPFTGTDADTYQIMAADISQILSTFKFTQ